MVLDASELAAFGELAEPFFQTPFEIYRPTVYAWPDDEVLVTGAYDYGDDDLVGDPGTTAGVEPIDAATGWFFSNLQASNEIDAEQIVVINDHFLRCLRSVDLISGDLVVRLDDEEGGDFVVIDVDNDDTFASMLRARIKRREGGA